MTIPLICVPHAGAGASAYGPWRHQSVQAVKAVPVQLPGRESEYNEPFVKTMYDAVEHLADRIRAAAGDGPFAVFGHSLGAVIAFEAAHRLHAAGGPAPVAFFASGSSSPRHRSPLLLPTDDEEAVDYLHRMTGRGFEALADSRVRALMLPILRADLGLLADYRRLAPVRLPTPITAVRGADDVLVPVDHAQDWSEFSDVSFRFVELPGGHMYLTDCWPQLWELIEEAL